MLFASPLVLSSSINVRRRVFAVKNQILVVSIAARGSEVHMLSGNVLSLSTSLGVSSVGAADPLPLTLCYFCLIFTDKADLGFKRHQTLFVLH